MKTRLKREFSSVFAARILELSYSRTMHFLLNDPALKALINKHFEKISKYELQVIEEARAELIEIYQSEKPILDAKMYLPKRYLKSIGANKKDAGKIAKPKDKPIEKHRFDVLDNAEVPIIHHRCCPAITKSLTAIID